jgi:hypothetical protein
MLILFLFSLVVQAAGQLYIPVKSSFGDRRPPSKLRISVSEARWVKSTSERASH